MKQKRSNTTPGNPPVWKKLFGTAAVALLLGTAVLAGFYWEKNSVVRDVRFTGHHFTRTMELESAVELPTGLHPDSIRFGELIDAFNRLPYVERTGIRVEAGGRMVIDIRERQPLALLTHGARKVYIDREGVKLPLHFETARDVPLLHGVPAEPLSEPLSGEEFEQLRDFLLAARKSRLGWITISEVAWSSGEGVVALTQENGVKLQFGRGDFSQKLEYWDEFYRNVVASEGIHSFSVIDLRFRNQIVTR